MSLQLAAASHIYIHYALKKEKRAAVVTCHTARPGLRRPNTDSTPNKPVTLPRNQLLIRYAVTRPVHTITIRCDGTR